MSFDYIIDKINDARFEKDPFKFIYIEYFLTPDHFDFIRSYSDIQLNYQLSTENLMNELKSIGYTPVEFPGCTIDESAYLNWYQTQAGPMPLHAHGLIEGFGMAYRLQFYRNTFISEFISFLNSDLFLRTLMNKFDIHGEMVVETAIQKYLSGYEISPHPDIRKKAMTYMLNINPDDVEHLSLGTNFMKFKPNKEWIYKEWKENVQYDRCWVPWDWCDTVFTQTKNNSITIFAPDYNTLHSVKLNYDHCKTQRTQVYGNLWHKVKPEVKPRTWQNYHAGSRDANAQ